jgi:hypothetical protein
MATYQFLGDSGKTRQLAELFVPDALFETNNGRFVGRDAILGFFVDTKGAFVGAGFSPARHYLSSIYIDVRSDGGASTYACFQFVGSRGLDHWGTYRDEVAPIGDRWQFTRRQAIVDGCVPASPVRTMLGLKP